MLTLKEFWSFTENRSLQNDGSFHFGSHNKAFDTQKKLSKMHMEI